MLARDDQHVAARGGVDVHERDRALVLVDARRRDLARDDLAEHAVGIGSHGRADYARAGSRAAARARASSRVLIAARVAVLLELARAAARARGPGTIPSSRASSSPRTSGAGCGAARSASAASSIVARDLEVAPRSPARRCGPRVASRSATVKQRDVGAVRARWRAGSARPRAGRAGARGRGSRAAGGGGSAPRRSRAAARRRAAAAARRARAPRPRASWPMNVDAPVRPHAARLRLGGVVQQRGPAHRPAARELVGERLGQQRADRVGLVGSPARPGRARAPAPVEHLERVVVDVGWWKSLCSTPRSASSSGRTSRGQPVRLHQLEAAADVAARATTRLSSAKIALGRRRASSSGARARRPPQRWRGRSRARARPRCRTARSVRSGSSASALGRDHPQPPAPQVRAAAVRIEQLAAAERLGHRVDREVARARGRPRCRPSRSVDEVDVPGVARADDAPGAERRRESWNAAPPVARASARARLARVARRRATSTSSVVAAEQPVAHRAADQPRVLARPAPRARPRAARAGSHGARAARAPRCRR